MSKSSSARNSTFFYFFLLTLLLTVVAYVLRGYGIGTFLPGGLILILIALCIVTGLLSGIEKTKRF